MLLYVVVLYTWKVTDAVAWRMKRELERKHLHTPGWTAWSGRDCLIQNLWNTAPHCQTIRQALYLKKTTNPFVCHWHWAMTLCWFSLTLNAITVIFSHFKTNLLHGYHLDKSMAFTHLATTLTQILHTFLSAQVVVNDTLPCCLKPSDGLFSAVNR